MKDANETSEDDAAIVLGPITKTPNGYFITPDQAPNLRKMCEKYGMAETSTKLGFSPGSVHEMLKSQKVRPSTEMAAAHLLGAAKVKKPALDCFVCLVPDDKADAFRMLVKGLEIKTMNWKL